MKQIMKKRIAKVVAFVMVMSTVFGSVLLPSNSGQAAPLSQYLNLDFGVKYSGEKTLALNTAKTIGTIEYYNVNNSAFTSGDLYYLSFKVSGASDFKQIAAQSSLNNWDWNSAPKTWSENGIADGTTVAGIVEATQNGSNTSFKMQFDNPVDTIDGDIEVSLTDLYIVKVASGSATTNAIPANQFIDLGKKYEGEVEAVKDTSGAYNVDFFNISNSAYSQDDTFVFYCKVDGASDFKQVAVQSALNNWSWNDAIKLWKNAGLEEPQKVAGAMTATSAGNGVSLKVRFDTLVSTDPGDSVNVTLSDLVVVKVTEVGNNYTFPSNKMIDLNKTYTGSAVAEKSGSNYNIQYINVNDSAYTAGDQFLIHLKISDADMFKQAVIQTSLDGWSWPGDTVLPKEKVWNGDGIEDGTVVDRVVTATGSGTGVALKLWLDNEIGTVANEVTVGIDEIKVEKLPKYSSLQSAYDGIFDMGTSVTATQVQDVKYANLIKTVYGTITPENEGKPDALLNVAASQDAVDGNPVLYLQYSGLSKILDFAKANNMKVRFHALVYAAQTPAEFFLVNYGKNGNTTKASATVMENRMESYITQVISFIETNYPGVVTAYDVVNEALEDNGSFKDNDWFDAMDYEYVTKAFEFAKAALPSGSTAKLYYNDYNLEVTAKCLAVVDLKDICDEVDGVGMQMHATTSYPNPQAIRNAIQAFDTAKMDVQCTELEIQIESGTTFSSQAQRYCNIIEAFYDGKVSNITFWGIDDGTSWRSAKTPTLFNADLTPKAAFNAIISLID